MDILYKLPFTIEVCSKIFMFVCKSPYTDLGSVVLKHIIGFNIYDKLVEYGGIVLDGKRNQPNFKSINTVWCLNHKERKQMNFDIYHLNTLQNLTVIKIFDTGVNGDIAHLRSLYNLTKIWFDNVGIYGDIGHLNMLIKLNSINLGNTGVTGDIANLKSLLNLNDINIYNTGVFGDIIYIKDLHNINMILFSNTGIYGNKQEFYKYRQSKKLGICIVNID